MTNDRELLREAVTQAIYWGTSGPNTKDRPFEERSPEIQADVRDRADAALDAIDTHDRSRAEEAAAISAANDHLFECLQKAKARIAELEAAQAWRPIETAPKDGAWIMLWTVPNQSDGGVPWWEIAQWHAAFNRWHYSFHYTRTPTHWRALPDPPAEGVRPMTGAS